MFRSKVHVVDDEGDSRRFITNILQSVGLLVKTYQSAESFLTGFEPDDSGCILLDVCMPGMSGLELQQRMIHAGVTATLVMMTGHGSARNAAQAMKNGAFDFLEKPLNPAELIDAMHNALRWDESQRLINQHHLTLQKRTDSLTPREKEVMDLVVSGYANKQVAAAIGTCQRTAETHRNRVMHKMKADSLADLVKMSMILSCPHQSGSTQTNCLKESAHCNCCAAVA